MSDTNGPDFEGGEGTQERAVTGALRWAAGLAGAFGALSALVALRGTDRVDRWGLSLARSIASYPLDVAASIINILGQAEVTGPVALILAVVWWRRAGPRGLAPCLLFVGVAVEAVTKHLVAHAGPPPELSRNLVLLPFLRSASPYSFPSGHMLRTTFLAALVTNRPVFWTLVVAMGCARVYLGEHWVSDVAGGFLLGMALAALAAAIYAGGPEDDEGRRESHRRRRRF